MRSYSLYTLAKVSEYHAYAIIAVKLHSEYEYRYVMYIIHVGLQQSQLVNGHCDV